MCFLTHCENTGTEIDPKYVIKTIGKLLSEKVTLEGKKYTVCDPTYIDADIGECMPEYIEEDFRIYMLK